MDRDERETLAWINARRDRLELEALDALPPGVGDASPVLVAWGQFPDVDDVHMRFGALRWWSSSGMHHILGVPAPVERFHARWTNS